ncbi:Pkinase_Tyr domain-containing protein [Cephalotus follicularis]|uniref:non-specific serine/threonine protein kinase n=1 Tax=Cephalotus follicularis TaxID=3775 RepID=A0A1Q3CM23_CEPFO|nr:Pkinase_Tyr domain-containing protein [Cephalotus follicularis]
MSDSAETPSETPPEMSDSAETPSSSVNETTSDSANDALSTTWSGTGVLAGLNEANESPPPEDSSAPAAAGGGGDGDGGQTQSSASPPPSDNDGNSTPSPPPPTNSQSSPPPSPSSNVSPPPSPPSSDSPPPKSSPTPSSPPPSSSSSSSSSSSPPPTSSSSSSPPSPPPPSSSKQSPTPPSSSPPPPDNDAPSPPSNENTTPQPPSESSNSPPSPSPPPPTSISLPNPTSPPSPLSDNPSSPSPVVITPGTQSPTSPPSRVTPSLGPTSKANQEANSSSTSSSNGSTEKAVVGVAVAGVFLIALIAIFFAASMRRKRRRADAYAPHFMPPGTFSVKSDGYYYAQQQSMVHSGPADPYSTTQHSYMGHSYGSQRGQMYHGGGPDSGVIGGGKTHFSYEELMEITGGFSRQNILGEGGFGCVFKGWLPDGKVVAVKQLKAGSGQGEREFRAEVEIISRVHHRHLVSLVGYCISESHRLLIYEFVPNNTLEHHLHDKELPVLDWPQRVKIAIGSAKGLAYLHEDCHPKIIHRDIKSANILLDDEFEAQVADFGLAKLNDSTQTHVSTRVMGTFGYMAPEYASSGKLTDRSDVFSFGVVLLELITGRKPVDPTQPLGDESLVEWARPLLVHALETGDISELVDPRLQKHYIESEVFRMIEAAAACVRHSAPKRPRMVQVVRALDSEGEMSDLSNGVRYGQSTVYESGQYNQDIMRFRRMALGSGQSSEFDMNSGDHSTREGYHGYPNSRMSSGEFRSGESETRAMNGRSRSQGSFGGPHQF